MSAITESTAISAVVKPGSDGMVHLQVPANWLDHEVHVTAEVRPKTRPKIVVGLLQKLYPNERIWIADDFDAPLEEFREYME